GLIGGVSGLPIGETQLAGLGVPVSAARGVAVGTVGNALEGAAHNVPTAIRGVALGGLSGALTVKAMPAIQQLAVALANDRPRGANRARALVGVGGAVRKF